MIQVMAHDVLLKGAPCQTFLKQIRACCLLFCVLLVVGGWLWAVSRSGNSLFGMCSLVCLLIRFQFCGRRCGGTAFCGFRVWSRALFVSSVHGVACSHLSVPPLTPTDRCRLCGPCVCVCVCVCQLRFRCCPCKRAPNSSHA